MELTTKQNQHSGANLSYSWFLRGNNSNGEPIIIRPEAMMEKLEPSLWRGHPEVAVDFIVEIVQDKIGFCKLAYRNVPANVQFCAIGFPTFEMALTAETSAYFSESQGLKVSNFAGIEKFSFKPEDHNYVFETRFRSMRFAALDAVDCKAFIAIDDLAGNAKSGDLYCSADRKKCFFDVVTPLPLNGESSYLQSFGIMVCEFSGSWYDAAMLYKKLLPLERRALKRSGEKMRDIAIWWWNRDQAANVIPPAEQLMADTGVPVALDWYWYHQNAYDTCYPDFYPPREGVDFFTERLDYLRKKGIFTHVYVNGFLWDMENANWAEGGSEGVIMDESGKIVSTAFNAFIPHQMAYMCGTAKNFQEKLSAEITKLANCNLEGIYIDMIGCATQQFCYNPAHSHAPGGGNYMAVGYRNFLESLHRSLPELYLSTEDCNETYMDKVDSVISIMSPSGERYGFIPPFEFVPIFSAVHHGRLTMYGSSAHIDGIPPYDSKWPAEGKWKVEEDWNSIAPYQFFVELGRSVIWGQQPMVANLRPEHLQNKQLSGRYKFICHTARFYYENRDFLYDGAMLNPGHMECPTTKVEFIVRYIFTKEGSYKVVSRVMPSVLHSVWENAAGAKALVVLNYTDRAQFFTFTSADNAVVKEQIPPETFKLYHL